MKTGGVGGGGEGVDLLTVVSEAGIEVYSVE